MGTYVTSSRDRWALKYWLKSGHMDKGTWYPTTAGTPQGGLYPPPLAHRVLDGMDATLDEEVLRKSGKEEIPSQPGKVGR